MKITFVQNDEEHKAAMKVIDDGLALRKPKAGTWIIPPGLSKTNEFTVVDSATGTKKGDVFVESFSTLDGAVMWALGIHEADTKTAYDHAGSVKERGNFV